MRKEIRMKFKISGAFLFLVLWMAFLSAAPALADKAAVAIEAPKDAAKGSEVVIRLTVTHGANSERHHVEWVKVWANNQELTKWEFSSSKLPEGVPFTREVKYKVEGDAEIKAEASCNLHGSKGPTTIKILMK
jgi:desulfoferrodoxin (superoxide reductase-like protein)